MAAGRRGWKFWFVVSSVTFWTLAIAAAFHWRDTIIEALSHPKDPFVKSAPPDPPNYAVRGAWGLLPTRGGGPAPPADVFFLSPTTYSGNKHWNGPILNPGASEMLANVVLPNYAAPFAGVGQVFAPRFRQASLYTRLNLWDDAIDARRFAYRDVKAAFEFYREHLGKGRPFLIVGVEQGGELAARLLAEEIAPNPELRERLVGAYLMETVVPADEHGPGSPIPACIRRAESGCLVAWASRRRGDFAGAAWLTGRAMVWNQAGRLVPLGARPPLCVNPLLGAASDDDVLPRQNLGAAAATGLEWGVRPAFLVRQVGAQCQAGVLRVTKPHSALLQPSGSWLERAAQPGFNLFWADLEADAEARLAAWKQAHPASAPAPGRQSNTD